MKRLAIIVLVICLVTLAACTPLKSIGDTLRHLGGSHSSEVIKKIVEAATVIKADIETIVVRKTWWIIPAAIFGIGAAAGLAVLKQVKLALALAVAWGVVLVLAIAVFKHFALIGYIVLGIGLLLVGYVLYQAWLYRDGFSRLFLTGEAGKTEMDEVAKTNTYGGKDDHGIAGALQNSATERLVLLERKKNGSARD